MYALATKNVLSSTRHPTILFCVKASSSHHRRPAGRAALPEVRAAPESASLQEVTFAPTQLSVFVYRDLELCSDVRTKWSVLNMTIWVLGTPSAPSAHFETVLICNHHISLVLVVRQSVSVVGTD